MSNTSNPKTRSQASRELRQLDIQFRDKLILKDGAAVQVVQELDGLIEVAGYSRRFINRHEIQNHYPYSR